MNKTYLEDVVPNVAGSTSSILKTDQITNLQLMNEFGENCSCYYIEKETEKAILIHKQASTWGDNPITKLWIPKSVVIIDSVRIEDGNLYIWCEVADWFRKINHI